MLQLEKDNKLAAQALQEKEAAATKAQRAEALRLKLEKDMLAAQALQEKEAAVAKAQQERDAKWEQEIASRGFAATTVVTWQCDTDNGAVDYDDCISAELENDYQQYQRWISSSKKRSIVTFTRDGISYEIDFRCSPMKQKRTDGKYSTERTVQRNEVEAYTSEGQAGNAMYPAGNKVEIRHQGAAVLDPELSKRFGEAATQFNEMLKRSGQEIRQVDYYGFENSQMQEAFTAKKAEFHSADKDDGEIWVFHGTGNEANIDSIMKGGFKIGGQGGHDVTNGTAWGQGVYTSTTPDDGPTSYGAQTRAVILSKALPGEVGAEGRSDSWNPRRDWQGFATQAQVLPCYVVRFK